MRAAPRRAASHRIRRPGRHNLTLGFLVGASLVVLGLMGLRGAGSVPFFGPRGTTIAGIFSMNHLSAWGLLGAGTMLVLGAWHCYQGARIMNVLVGALLLLIGGIGALLWQTPANIVALNPVDIAGLVGAGAVLLVAGLVPVRTFAG